MQLVASLAVIAIGVGLGFLADTTDIRLFGWVLAGIGVLGLAARALIARQRNEGGRPR